MINLNNTSNNISGANGSKNVFLGNAFSISMLGNIENSAILQFEPISQEEARNILADRFVSAVGHKDTAVILTGLLRLGIPENRINVTLGREDILIVAQYKGSRLPEGATTLPEGSSFAFFKVFHKH